MKASSIVLGPGRRRIAKAREPRSKTLFTDFSTPVLTSGYLIV
jgi:hypothetical protein